MNDIFNFVKLNYKYNKTIVKQLVRIYEQFEIYDFRIQLFLSSCLPFTIDLFGTKKNCQRINVRKSEYYIIVFKNRTQSLKTNVFFSN